MAVSPDSLYRRRLNAFLEEQLGFPDEVTQSRPVDERDDPIISREYGDDNYLVKILNEHQHLYEKTFSPFSDCFELSAMVVFVTDVYSNQACPLEKMKELEQKCAHEPELGVLYDLVMTDCLPWLSAHELHRESAMIEERTVGLICAITKFQGSRDLAVLAFTVWRWATRAILLGHFEAASDVLQLIVDDVDAKRPLSSEWANSYWVLGLAYALQGKWAEAERQFKTVVETKERDPNQVPEEILQINRCLAASIMNQDEQKRSGEAFKLLIDAIHKAQVKNALRNVRRMEVLWDYISLKWQPDINGLKWATETHQLYQNKFGKFHLARYLAMAEYSYALSRAGQIDKAIGLQNGLLKLGNRLHGSGMSLARVNKIPALLAANIASPEPWKKWLRMGHSMVERVLCSMGTTNERDDAEVVLFTEWYTPALEGLDRGLAINVLLEVYRTLTSNTAQPQDIHRMMQLVGGLARLYRAGHEYALAVPYYRQFAQLALLRWGINHPECRQAYLALNYCFFVLNRVNEAHEVDTLVERLLKESNPQAITFETLLQSPLNRVIHLPENMRNSFILPEDNNKKSYENDLQRLYKRLQASPLGTKEHQHVRKKKIANYSRFLDAKVCSLTKKNERAQAEDPEKVVARDRLSSSAPATDYVQPAGEALSSASSPTPVAGILRKRQGRSNFLAAKTSQTPEGAGETAASNAVSDGEGNPRSSPTRSPSKCVSFNLTKKQQYKCLLDQKLEEKARNRSQEEKAQLADLYERIHQAFHFKRSVQKASTDAVVNAKSRFNAESMHQQLYEESVKAAVGNHTDSSKSHKVPLQKFELPCDATSHRLKALRDSRLEKDTMQGEATAIGALQQNSATKTPLWPRFELPVEAVTRRKRETREELACRGIQASQTEARIPKAKVSMAVEGDRQQSEEARQEEPHLVTKQAQTVGDKKRVQHLSLPSLLRKEKFLTPSEEQERRHNRLDEENLINSQVASELRKLEILGSTENVNRLTNELQQAERCEQVSQILRDVHARSREAAAERSRILRTEWAEKRKVRQDIMPTEDLALRPSNARSGPSNKPASYGKREQYQLLSNDTMDIGKARPYCNVQSSEQKAGPSADCSPGRTCKQVAEPEAEINNEKAKDDKEEFESINFQTEEERREGWEVLSDYSSIQSLDDSVQAAAGRGDEHWDFVDKAYQD